MSDSLQIVFSSFKHTLLLNMVYFATGCNTAGILLSSCLHVAFVIYNEIYVSDKTNWASIVFSHFI